MNISYIAGTKSRRRIGNMGKYGTGGACGIGGVDTGETWAKKLGIWNSIPGATKILFYKNLLLLPYVGGREVVKALLRKNSGGFANSLARVYEIARANNATPEFKKYRELELLWLQKGGNPDELRVAFQEGNTKTPTGAKFNEILQKAKTGQSIGFGEAIAAGVSALFGKKYDPSTGKITGGDNSLGIGEPATAAEMVATVAVWLPIIREIAQILGDAFRRTPTPPDPTEQQNQQNQQGAGAGMSSALLPILLVGGAAAAYFILNKKK